MYKTKLHLIIVTCICIIISSHISCKEIPAECDVVQQNLHIKSCSSTVITCVVSEIQLNPGDTLTLTNYEEANFTSFELHISQIFAFPKEIFTQLQILEHVDLNGNELQQIPDRAFENAVSDLKEIELQFNLLREITAETFYGLRNLLFLDLSTNKIEMVSKKAFQSLKKLEYLDLSSNLITYFDMDTFNPLKSLKTLYLNHNDIVSINPKSFTNLHNLNILDLDGNRLEQLEIEISAVTLNALHVARNQLARVMLMSEEKRIEIRTFNLQNNYLTNLSDIRMEKGFFVRSLNLESNEISSLSNLPTFFKDLIRLNLHSNPITEIDFDMTSMMQLKHLDIGDLSHVILRSNIFKSLKGLQTLSLSENYLRGLDHEWFLGLSNLTELDLEMNFLRDFNYKALVGVLPSLKVLKLAQNDLNCTFLHEMMDFLKNSTNIMIPKDYSDSYGPTLDSTNNYEGISCDTGLKEAQEQTQSHHMGLRLIYWTIVFVIGLMGVLVGLAIASKKLKMPIQLPKWRRPVRRSLEVIVDGNTGVVQEHE